jgi:hypothetical protein
MTVDVTDEPPVKIQEDNGRGTAINCAEDHARLLQYWAWAKQSIAVGVGLNLDNHSADNNNNIYSGGPRRVPPATSDSTP